MRQSKRATPARKGVRKAAGERKARRPKLTRLGVFVKTNGIKPLVLADVTGISRQHLSRLRFGHSEPTRPVMIWLTIACRRLLGARKRVRMTDLFDLGEE